MAPNLNISKEARKYEALWMVAGQELRAIHTYTAPVDKIVCLMRAFTLVTNSLKMATGSGAAADDLLSCIVYIIIKTNPPLLYSTIKFLKTFRDPSFSLGVESYNLATLEIAVEFIDTISSSKLVGMDEKDFKKKKKEREGNFIDIPRAHSLGRMSKFSKELRFFNEKKGEEKKERETEKKKESNSHTDISSL